MAGLTVCNKCGATIGKILALVVGIAFYATGSVAEAEGTEAQTKVAPADKSSETQKPATTDSIALSKTYQDTASKFTIKYPADWELDQANPAVVMFRKPQEGSGFANVNVQIVLTKQSGGKYADIDEFLTSIETQGKARFTDFKTIAENSETLPSDPDKIKGKSITFTYKQDGTEIKQLQIILLSEDGKHFYMWGLTSTSDQYDKNLPVSDAMMDSWVFK